MVTKLYEQHKDSSNSCYLYRSNISSRGTFAATTTQTALAYQKKNRGQDTYKKGTRDNGNSKNGNTVTIQKCKQDVAVSGFDNTAEQECQNAICTHPSAMQPV